MPVIEIQALPQPEHVHVPTVIMAVSRRVAEALAIEPNQVWTVWRTIEPAQYAEGGTPAALQPISTHPPIVNIMAYQGRSEDMIRQVLATIADAICEHLRVDKGNAFVTWTELAAGRVYTGGAVR